MNIISINVDQGGCMDTPLLIGYAGEDNIDAVDFDFSAWVTAYGEGEIYLEIMRAKDTAPYLAILTVDGTVARWTISDVDTAKHGPGVAQLVYQPTGATKKSAIYKFFVGKSLTEPGGDDPWGPIIERMEEILAEVKEQADAADQSAQDASGSAKDAEAWAVGERGGNPVPATDPTHENNAKYYADEAGETVRTFTETTAPAAVQAVNTAGQTQVQAVNTAGAAKVQDVNTAGATQVQAVNTAGQTALTAIMQKSTEEQAAIQQKGEDTLASIPEDYTELTEDVDDLKSAVTQITQTNVGVNIFDENYDETGYINRGVNASSNNYKRTSKYYPIDASKLNLYVYHAQSLMTLAVVFYDSEMAWIKNYAANSTGLNTAIIPENAAYYRSYVDKSFDGNISISYVPVESYTPYQETTGIKDGIVDYENFNQSTKEKVFSWLAGKTIVFMGDSIVGNFYDSTGIAYKLSQLTGATVINCAFGGTQMALRNYNSELINAWNQLSGCKLADAISTNTFTAQDAALETITNEPAFFAERLATLKTVDWNNVDIVMWEYGLNDFQNNQTIIKDETDLTLLTSFYGAYCHTIETLLTAYPHLRIVPISPMWRFWKDGDAYLDGADEHIIGGRLLPEFCECVFEVSKKYHLPYIDDYYELGANQWTRTQYFTTDPAHPDANGRTRIANHIAHKLLTLM